MAITDNPSRERPARSWLARIAWLLALWGAGVLAMALAAWALKAAMNAVGLSSP
jgi:hypothetical protein